MTATATPAAKKTKAAKITKAKPAAKPREKKEGMLKPQVRILQYLAKQTEPKSRNQIAEKGKVDYDFLTSWLGSEDDDIRAKNDARKYMSLKSYGYIRSGKVDPDGSGKTVIAYLITASGRKALEKALKS